MVAGFERGAGRFDQTQVGLVDQAGRVQRSLTSCPPEPLMGERSQLRIDGRNELIESFLLACGPALGHARTVFVHHRPLSERWALALEDTDAPEPDKTTDEPKCRAFARTKQAKHERKVPS